MNNSINHQVVECLSHNIMYLRKKYNLSKKEMAKILDIGINTLNKLEQGFLPPRLSASVLFRIKDHFKISLSFQVSKKL